MADIFPRSRRVLAAICLLLALLCALVAGIPARAAAAASRTRAASARVDTQREGAYFAPGSVSFSTEVYELGQDDLTRANASLIHDFRQLGPGTLRIGGDTADESWWTSSDEPAPSWSIVTVNPEDLLRLKGFLTASGWRAVLTVDLGHFDPARAANEVVEASRILGSRLVGIEIGNEPNDFGLGSIGLRPWNFDVTEYAQQVAAYVSAIDAAAPGTRILGPDTSSQVWFDDLAKAKAVPVSALTEHYYPTSYSAPSAVCAGTSTPTAEQLLSSNVWSTESTLARSLVSEASADDLPAEVDETNDTSSCDEAGGPQTSPVFASAIWAMDWSLRAASAGVSSIAFHDEFGTCGAYAYSALCTADEAAELKHEVRERPQFYGLRAAAKLEGGHFVPVRITNGGARSHVSAYATIKADGVATIAVINGSFTSGLTARVTLPATGDTVSINRLQAPSPAATSGVTLATIARDAFAGKSASISLTPVSAAVITLAPRRESADSEPAASACRSESVSGHSQSRQDRAARVDCLQKAALRHGIHIVIRRR